MGLISHKSLDLLAKKGFPKRLIESRLDGNSFDTLESTEDHFLQTKVKVQKYVDQYRELPKGTGLVVVGKSGTGKTLLLSCAVLELCKKMAIINKVTMCTVDDIIIYTNNKWVGDNTKVDVLTPEILVIDDYPKTANKSRDPIDVVDNLYRRRLNLGKRTFISCDCESVAQIKQKFNSSFLSILTESAILLKDLIHSEDYRPNIKPRLK